MSYEGVIKFNYECLDRNYLIPEASFNKLNPLRNELKNKNYIGVYPDGICYGNVSLRIEKGNTFHITASDTGKFLNTDRAQYVKVTSCNLSNNQCLYKGPGLPSSESLSHYIIYDSCQAINAVIHIHDSALWKQLYNKVPTSSPDVTYGSLAMVHEIIRLLNEGPLMQQNILVMGGHPDGIICFGNSIDEAANLLKIY